MEENAGVNAIRKRYHKLGRFNWFYGYVKSAFSLFFLNNEQLVFLFSSVALQVHPDKNKHPNAEIAFKLVSEVFLLCFFFLLFIGYPLGLQVI